MKTREASRAFAQLQLDTNNVVGDKSYQWHYGKVEIEYLLDYIYGEDSKGVKVNRDKLLAEYMNEE